jgi:putative DNA primase/helicase
MWAGMATVSAAVDHRTTLKLAHGFHVKPILWLMTIGAPSDKKTPGANPMKSILKRIEDEDYPRYQRDLKIWEAREAIALAAKKRYHAEKSTPDASLDAAGGPDSMTFDDLPPELTLPPRPYQLQMEVSDITSQKLARTCHEQPRGVLCYLDEMKQWMVKMSDPKSGENRSTWVQAFEGSSYKVDRVADGAIHVENLSVSVYGNVQPRVFKEHARQLMSDGLLQRFLYVKLDPMKTGVGDPSPDSPTLHQWEQSIRLLTALPAVEYTLSDGAYKVYRQFQLYMDDVRKRERLLQSSDVYQEAISKQVGQCGRIALVWHLLESPWQTELSETLMTRVVRFVRGMVIPTMRQVLDVSLSESTLDNWIRDHILTRADKSSVTLPELKRGAHYQLQAMSKWEADSAIMDAMSDLERVQWVARMDDGSRASTVTWAINPRLAIQFKAQRDAVIAARQSRRNEIYGEYMLENPEYRPQSVYGYVPPPGDVP